MKEITHMAVIDSHAHIYPQKIARKAFESVGEFYNIRGHARQTEELGTAEDLLSFSKETPITHYIVHSVALAPKTVESINNFIAGECEKHPEFIGFATLHQDYADPEAEINRIEAMGLRGIKLHPDTQMVNIDDPRLMTIYEILEAKDLRLVIHTGDYRHDYSNPARLAKALKSFPNLKVDAAHFGSWSRGGVGYENLGEFENVFCDCSSSAFFMGEFVMTDVINKWGTDRVMFGSDYPMWSPAEEFEYLTRLPFNEDERENFLWHNAERFLGMKVE